MASDEDRTAPMTDKERIAYLESEVKFWQDQYHLAANVAATVADMDEVAPALRQLLRQERDRRKSAEAELDKREYAEHLRAEAALAAGPAPSIRATFDGRETGDRYHVTTTVNGRSVDFRKPLPDPFVRQTVYVGWRDVARGLLLDGRLVVEVTVGAELELMNDVLELDDNTLIAGRTRKAAFHSHLNEAVGRFGADHA